MPDDQVDSVAGEILDAKADDIAAQIGLINAGQIGNDLFATNWKNWKRGTKKYNYVFVIEKDEESYFSDLRC